MKRIFLKILLNLGFSRYHLYWWKQKIVSVIKLKKNSKNNKSEFTVHRYMDVQIANKKVVLDLNDSHEKKYYENYSKGILDIDYLIGREFIKQGDIVLDVGSNIGITGLHYLECGASEVHAFEPVPSIYNRLCSLKDAKFKTYPFALSDNDGISEIVISQTHIQGSTLNKNMLNMNPAVFGSKLQKINVDTRKLDSLFEDKKFDYIKVDIEGHEIPFLKGAEKILTNNKPRILQIEIFDILWDETNSLISNYFKYGYRILYNLNKQEIILIDPGDDTLKYKDFKSQPPIFIYLNEPVIKY